MPFCGDIDWIFLIYFDTEIYIYFVFILPIYIYFIFIFLEEKLSQNVEIQKTRMGKKDLNDITVYVRELIHLPLRYYFSIHKFSRVVILCDNHDYLVANIKVFIALDI